MGALDLVDWPADRTLTLSGSAGALKIPLTLRNDSAEPFFLADASVAEVRLVGAKSPLRAEPAPIQVSLTANGVTRTQVRLRLDPGTPPGRYEGRLKFAGLSRKVAIEVLPQVKLGLRPDPLVVDTGAGRQQSLAAAFENQGNVPLTIDVAGVYPLGEEVAITPARLEEANASAKPLAVILDRIIGRAPAPVLTPFGSLELSMPTGPEPLPPGETRTVLVSVNLPENLSPSVRYHLFAPLYASDLHLIIVTAAKPPALAAPARRTKGAKA